MPYDGFIFTDDAPEEIKKKHKEEYEKRFQKKPTPSYSMRPQPAPYYFTREQIQEQKMKYSLKPEYSHQKQAPKEKPIHIGKEIGSAIKAVHKFNANRRQAKINEVKNLKKDINQRLEALRTQNEVARLKKAQQVLKTAKQREAIANAKQAAQNAGNRVKTALHEANIKVRGSIYGK